jgi:hypothetical protein
VNVGVDARWEPLVQQGAALLSHRSAQRPDDRQDRCGDRRRLLRAEREPAHDRQLDFEEVRRLPLCLLDGAGDPALDVLPPLLGADGGEEVVDRPGRIATGVTLVDHAPADVAEVVFAVHRDPDLVARPLAAFEPTLLHGDAKPHNLGLGRDTVIAIDWGDLTGFGPPAAEIAWYAVCAAGRLPCSPDDMFTDYQDLSGAQIDPAEIDLALVGALAQLGFYLPPTELDWWCHRVRSALERRHF